MPQKQRKTAVKRGRGRPQIGVQPVEKLSISLPGELVRELDAARKRTGEARSAIARRLLEAALA